MRTGDIVAPIFIIGCGRSGTTVLYELLCCHSELAWFSNYTNRWPRRPELATLSRLPWTRNLGHFKPLTTRPVEGYRIFDACRSSDRLRPLTESDVSEAERICLRQVIAQHLRYQHSSRFINKNTRNSRCIRYLKEVFPDGLFIHVIRDPRATVASLLKVSWWPDLQIWSHGGLTPSQWESQGEDATVLAAQFWVYEVSQILKDKGSLSASQYLEIHYEELTTEPESTISRILDFARLPWTKKFRNSVDSFKLINRNVNVKDRLSRVQMETIDEETSELASLLGY